MPFIPHTRLQEIEGNSSQCQRENTVVIECNVNIVKTVNMDVNTRKKNFLLLLICKLFSLIRSKSGNKVKLSLTRAKE